MKVITVKTNKGTQRLSRSCIYATLSFLWDIGTDLTQPQPSYWNHINYHIAVFNLTKVFYDLFPRCSSNQWVWRSQ